MNRILKYGILILLIGLVLAGASGCGGFLGEGVKAEIASRLKTKPSWGSIRDQLYDVEFKPGMSRVEVHEVLGKVGAWKNIYYESQKNGSWDPDTKQITFREIIRFDEYWTQLNLRDWVFQYDKNDRLVSLEIINS